MAEPSTVTGLRRELGNQLAKLREASDIRQGELATLVGYSRSTVANVEAGRQKAALPFWEKCDEVLLTSGELAAGYRQIEEAVSQQRREQAAAARRAREAQIQEWRASSGLAPMTTAVERQPDVAPRDEAVVAVIHKALGSGDGFGDSADTASLDDLEQRVITAYQQAKPKAGKLSLTLVGGYAGSGKSEFARFLSAITGWTILDKDTLTRALVEQLLLAYGGDLNDRQSQLYLDKVRPYEYRCLLDAAVENMKAGVSTVLTAPFLREFADSSWLQRVQNRCVMYDASLAVVWVKCDPESMYDYITYRGAARDTWKLSNWDEYIAGIDTTFEPGIPHYTVDNQLNAAVAIADQARDFALRMQA